MKGKYIVDERPLNELHCTCTQHTHIKENGPSAFLKLMKMGEEGECTLQQFIQIFEMLLAQNFTWENFVRQYGSGK